MPFALILVLFPAACRRARPEPAGPPSPPFASTPLHARVTGDGALLTPSSRVVARAATPAPDQGLVEDGWQGRAAFVHGPAGAVAAVVERRPVAGDRVLERDLVYRLEDGRWSLALELTQSLGPGESGARLRTDDLLGDGRPFVIFVFPDTVGSFPDTAGSQGTTPNDRAVDVVDDGGAVVVHRELFHGVVRRAPSGGLETWNLAPGTHGQLFRHEVDRLVAGSWRAEVSEQLGVASVPGEADRY